MLSPADELKTFVLPPGYRAELVASEPLIDHPILTEWDGDGRMWIIELVGYQEDLAGTTDWEPTSRVSVLEDTNQDGRMDKKTVFSEGLVLPRSLKVLSDSVLVAEPAKVWRMRWGDSGTPTRLRWPHVRTRSKTAPRESGRPKRDRKNGAEGSAAPRTCA